MAQILIVEDEVLLAKSLSRALTTRGHDCITVTSAEEGIRLLEQMPTDIVLLDIQLPGMSGLEAVKHVRKIDPNISVIIATAYATMASAIEAIRAGASDFLRKPLDIEEVALAVERAVTGARLRQTISYYNAVEAEKTDEDAIISLSPKMRNVESIIERLLSLELASVSDYPPVLILGETGVGKDLIARTIHYRGKFSDQPFVEVNCTTLPKGLEEAELFGYEKGAFTGADKSKRGLFEAASGGTVFLNEIGDLSLESQIKLMQVIERKSLRRVGGMRDIATCVRIIAATNRNLKDPSRFREDLYYRLNNVTIELPPLRDRREDIPGLVEHFLRRYGNKYRVHKSLDTSALQALTNYHWPGNVREMRQLIERVVFLNANPVISSSDLNLHSAESKSSVRIDQDGGIDIHFPAEGIDIESVERELILKALESCAGNISEAARKLHLGREALRYRIRKFDIQKQISIVG